MCFMASEASSDKVQIVCCCCCKAKGDVVSQTVGTVDCVDQSANTRNPNSMSYMDQVQLHLLRCMAWSTRPHARRCPPPA